MIVGRWLADVAAALARDLGLAYRLDLALPRRRLGLKRARPPATGPEGEDDAVAAIEARARQDSPGTTPLEG